MREIISACRSTRVNRQTVKLTPGSSAYAYQADMQTSQSKNDQTARISLQITINVKKQRKQNHGKRVTLSTHRPVCHSQIVSAPPRLSTASPPRPTLPSFGERVFRPQHLKPQEGKDGKMIFS